MALTNTTLDVTPTALFTSTGTNAVIVMYLCNTNNSTPAQFSLYAVPAGAQADMTTVIYSEVSLTSGDTYVLDTERLLLDSGDSIWGAASVAASIVVTVNTIAV
jgi:hypothetical protein